MQLVNCLVALAGDLNNKGVKVGITPAEVHVLRTIHGIGSISDVEIVRKMETHEYSHEGLYAELKFKYPIYEEQIQAYWRDNGARFPIDIRDLDLPEGAFRLPVDMMVERLNADAVTEEPPSHRRGRKPRATPVPEPIDPTLDDELPPED